MTSAFPLIHLVRHGETEWSRSGKHTGRTDVALTQAGEQAARALSAHLHSQSFSAVWSSPSQRARQTCELAGFGPPEIKPELAEWDYGVYEGITTPDILKQRPGWQVFRDGCPQGESADDVGARADRIIQNIRDLNAPVLIFSSAHFLRVLAARWLRMPPEQGANFYLDTASISVLGYEHCLDEPIIRRWNQQSYV